MGYYPIFVEMTGRPCAVVGGGLVAERKVAALFEAGARVTVISPNLTTCLQSWASEGRLNHVARDYRRGDLGGFEMVFVATDNAEVNAAIARDGREQRVWVNSADDLSHCDFILPSVLRRGELVVAVGTGGSSPALARAIREELESYFSADYDLLLQVAAEVRVELKNRSVVPNAELWRKALADGFRNLIAAGKKAEAKAYLVRQLEGAPCK